MNSIFAPERAPPVDGNYGRLTRRFQAPTKVELPKPGVAIGQIGEISTISPAEKFIRQTI